MKLTPIQIIGIIIVVNGALIGSTAQLTDLLGAIIAKDIVSFASIGNSIFGGIIMMLSGQGAMVKSVLSMPGVERIDVNGQASSTLATLAVDPSQNKISPTMAAMDKVTATAKAAAMILLAAFLLSLFLPTGSAMAQSRRSGPAFTGDPVADIKTDLSKAGIKVPTVTAGAACDFNIFALLNPSNVVTTIQNCVSDANKPFLPDVQAALDSATTANDKPGIDCLAPALAIVKAAVGTPGTPAVEAIPANGTTPAVAAVPAVPAQMAGIILIFQKFREFTLANGPSACKNWVQSTINGAVSGAT